MDVPVSGHCDARFRAVREEFVRNFAERGEVGAAVCVVVDGTTVVDLAGGWADRAARAPWQRDTLVDFYSVGKAFVALLALQLVDAGLLALDDPIAEVWPEFAAADKEGATLRHALCHRAGVPAIREALTDDDLWDWHRMAGALAATAPWWEPGTRHAYHTNTYGHLIGEVVRRVGGEPVGRRLHGLAGPLDADVHVGLSPVDQRRCAEVLFDSAGPPAALDDALEGLEDDAAHGNAELLQPSGLFLHGRGQHRSLARRRGPVDQRARLGARRGAPVRRAARSPAGCSRPTSSLRRPRRSPRGTARSCTTRSPSGWASLRRLHDAGSVPIRGASATSAPAVRSASPILRVASRSATS